MVERRARDHHGDDSMIQPKRFDAEVDLPPLPFDPRHTALARQLKERGLPWTPHVGCFVWDPDERIAVTSPFPERIYFILSLPRFLRGFGSLEAMTEQLVWLPTWHQARLLCRQLGIADREVTAIWAAEPPPATGEELLAIYRLLDGALPGQ
jgi:hypothetical protein